MIKKLFFLMFLLFISPLANAEIKLTEAGGIIYIKKTTVSELENIFKKHNYLRFRGLDDNAYPAIFLTSLPTDFSEIKSQKYRNELFIRILTPLAMKINEEISNERSALLRLEKKFAQDGALSPKETQKLETLALKYDVFTRLKDTNRISYLLENLKQRVDIVPPSILVAIAAMESNWGTSRVATLANSLYKEKIWYTNEGLEPLENKDDGYRFKIFDSLIDGMRSFALTFNSNKDYEAAWLARALSAERHDTVAGESIAYALALSSNLPNFAGILDYTAAFYDFMSLDLGHLKRIKSNVP